MVIGKPLPKEVLKVSMFKPMQFSLANSGYTLNLTKSFNEPRKLYLYDEGIVICFSKALPN